jgi:hypothetical protein
MTVIVYHNNNPHALFQLGPDPDAFVNIIKVAEVDTDELGEAYSRTNHIEECWMYSSDRQVRAEPGNHRSTSVGDVLEKDGVRYVVTATGFQPL